MKRNRLNRLLALVLALVFVLSVTGCGGKDTPASSSAPVESSSQAEVSSKVEESSSAPASSEPDEEVVRVFQIEKIDKALLRNGDTAGWLYIPNTTIDDCVLQSTDNDYYLRLTEDKTYDIFGCYFADYRCSLDLGREYLSRNTIIYGHSDYKDNPEGKKFSQLFHYAKDIEFVKNNPYIYFSTNTEDLVWQVFAVFYTDVNFNYIQPDPSDAEFMKIVEEAKAKSEYIIDVPVTKDDKILTLSTCTGLFKQPKENYRMAVMAKLLPSNEIPVSKLTMEVAPNPNPKRD